MVVDLVLVDARSLKEKLDFVKLIMTDRKIPGLNLRR